MTEDYTNKKDIIEVIGIMLDELDRDELYLIFRTTQTIIKMYHR